MRMVVVEQPLVEQPLVEQALVVRPSSCGPNFVRTLVTLAGATLLPLPAHAQPAATIQRYLSDTNKGCDLFGYQEYYWASVPALAQPVTIAAYTLEGCGGGNSYHRTVGVFQLLDGKVQSFRAPPIQGPPLSGKAAVKLQGDRLTVRSLAHGPNDPRCCPTIARTATFRLGQGVITPSR